MLDSNDFVELEKKYNLYQKKKNKKIYILVSILAACILSLSIALVMINMQNKDEILAKDNSKQIQKEQTQQVEISSSSIKQEPAKEEIKEPKKAPTPKISDLEDTSQLQIGELSLAPIAITKKSKPKPKIEKKEVIPPPIEEKIVLNEQNTSIINENIINEPKEENKIQISTKEINSIDELKQKCDYTNNSHYCSALAEKLYEDKYYKDAIKYALKANSIDSENEKSWIIFAKSKAKLGHKNDAIKILQTYLNSSPSKQVEFILEEIKRGTL